MSTLKLTTHLREIILRKLESNIIKSNLVIYTPLSPAITTEVYDSYWKFATLRQEVFFNRVEERAYPWSADPILNQYKFTNAYRAADRVSQYLIKNVL